MPPLHRYLDILAVLRMALVLVPTLGAIFGPVAWAQDDAPLRVAGLGPGGLRISVTERWGEVSFTVQNTSNGPREARVVAAHSGEENTEYARDVWVPANASVTLWMSLGPVPALKPGDRTISSIGRTIQYKLYDLTSGTPVLVRPPGEAKLRDRAVLYKSKSEYSTSLFTDASEDTDPTSFRQSSVEEEATNFVRVMRSVRGQSELISVVRDKALPATPEAYDGVDQVVMACNHMAHDPQSRAALRRWIERGGQLWVMLDLVEIDFLGSLLGEECAPQIVDRTSLSTVRFQRSSPINRREPIGEVSAPREFEQPVKFVRVALTGRESVFHYVDSWPASFAINVGRGRILVTTLGARAWYRPRVTVPVNRPGARSGAAVDPPSPYPTQPDFPVHLEQLLELSNDLKSVEHPFTVDDLRPIVLDEIGYSVPERGLVVTIFAVFVAVLAAIGLIVRRSRRSEIVGWLTPMAAAVAGLAFYLVGGATRHSIPQTATIAEIAEAVPGSGEIARVGVFAAYKSEAGPMKLSAPHGGILDFDFQGLEGQSRVRVQTDRDSWHYEQLALPAGVRLGNFRTTQSGSASAVATFGPDGIQGKLVVQGYQNPVDAILAARERDPSAVRISPDGRFHIGRDELLEPDQFLTETVLSDRQQRRQAVYRKLLGSGLPDYYDNRDILMAWVTPEIIPFRTNDEARLTGTSLLTIPIDFERPAVGTKVFVPRSQISYKRWLEGNTRAPTMESTRPIDMRLRFQLPASVVPMVVEKATFIGKIRAPSRRLRIQGYTGDRPETIHEVESPTEPIRVTIENPKLLQLDARGGLHVGIVIADVSNESSVLQAFWTIESLHLEVTGSTLAPN